MDIEKALKCIKKNLRKRVVESRHFKEQCKERKLDTAVVRNIVHKNKILGLVKQDEGLYKIWFVYEKHKDLNIIVRIPNTRSLRFVTVFPCYAERRKR
jgi:hypothetical protein